MASNWMIGLKKRGFPGISDRTSWFFSFPKKEKLIDTGFCPFGFSGLWISNLLDGLVFLDIERLFDQSTSDTKVYCGKLVYNCRFALF